MVPVSDEQNPFAAPWSPRPEQRPAEQRGSAPTGAPPAAPPRPDGSGPAHGGADPAGPGPFAPGSPTPGAAGVPAPGAPMPAGVLPGGPGAAPGEPWSPPVPVADSWGRPTPSRRPRRRGVGAGTVVGLVALSLVAGGAAGWAGAAFEDRTDPRSEAPLPVSVTSDRDVEDLTGVARIAAEVLPSVVSIEVSTPAGNGTGSGFVLREDGHILTNNHVVSAAAGGGRIVVVFADGTQSEATIVGRTPEYDLAVIRVDRTGLAPLALADSDDVVVGDPVVAIGAPLGLQGTVTTGIVSALNRPVSAGDQNETAFINAIQTDAAINPGNSGGPLVNAAGEVVGINSAIAQSPGLGQTGGSIGLGFAIPSNQARRTAEELIATGEATYPVIGVLLDQRYTGEGVQVATEPQQDQRPVTPGGPADRAGIRPGDVITAIDGRPVTEADELIVAIRARAPGDAVTLTVRTGDSEREVRVVLDVVPTD